MFTQIHSKSKSFLETMIFILILVVKPHQLIWLCDKRENMVLSIISS